MINKEYLKDHIRLSSEHASEELYVELVRHKSGSVSLYLGGERTPFIATGGGYDKYGVVMESFIDYYTGRMTMSHGAAGMSTVIAEALADGVEIEQIGYTKSGILYYIRNKQYGF